MQHDAIQELEQSIEGLYSAFAGYPLKPRIYGCECCVSPKDDVRIHSKPLRQLDWADLQRFAHKSMSTWGDVDDFKHFLPRLLELLPELNSWPICMDRLCPKIYEAGFQDWPEAERLAVDAYFLALWRAVVLTDVVPMNCYEFLSAMVSAQAPVQPFLDDLAKMLEEAGTALHKLLYLVESVAWNHLYPAEAYNLLGEWSLDIAEEHGWSAISRWLTKLELKASLEDLYFQQEDTDFARQLSRAIQQLDALQSARLFQT